jgi:endonuclease YncB( thermonuclease family)
MTPQGTSYTIHRERARILRVIDGDTFVCVVNDIVETVRLLGIDCFESARTPKLRKQAARAKLSVNAAQERGKQAELYCTSLLTGVTVELRKGFLGVPERDHFGRLLREIWFEGESLAERLRKRGFAAPESQR